MKKYTKGHNLFDGSWVPHPLLQHVEDPTSIGELQLLIIELRER